MTVKEYLGQAYLLDNRIKVIRGCRISKYFLLGGSPALCPNGIEIGHVFDAILRTLLSPSFSICFSSYAFFSKEIKTRELMNNIYG